ncbi:hypothetical protein BGW80DRAFT_1446868 [Lactifluus volemus]|nr:hypothetical protein BGW80DRAFT_1446868 [Lactifluus volemus]
MVAAHAITIDAADADGGETGWRLCGGGQTNCFWQGANTSLLGLANRRTSILIHNHRYLSIAAAAITSPDPACDLLLKSATPSPHPALEKKWHPLAVLAPGRMFLQNKPLSSGHRTIQIEMHTRAGSTCALRARNASIVSDESIIS